MTRARVFIATSLDSFIAGPNDELDWLPQGADITDTFTPFLAQVGAMLMGRRTFDVVTGFEGKWPYGDTPVVVATSRPLPAARQSVRSATGHIGELIALAKELAGDRDVYVDGGTLIRAALDANLIDELTVTMVPIVLGAGVPLFAGIGRRHELALHASRPIGGGLVQLTYLPQHANKQ